MIYWIIDKCMYLDVAHLSMRIVCMCVRVCARYVRAGVATVYIYVC